MKGLKNILIISLSLTLVMSSCQTAKVNHTAEGIEEAESTVFPETVQASELESQPMMDIDQIVYCSSFDSMYDSVSLSEGTIKKIDGITFSSMKDIEYKITPPVNVTNIKENVPNRMFSVDGKTYTVEYVGSKSNALASSEVTSFQKLGVIDVYQYRNEDDIRVEIECLENSDIITWFSLSGNGIRHVEGDFTAEQATEAGREAIGTLYGEEVLKDYTPEEVYFNITTETWCVNYNRYIHGYCTNDNISLFYNKKGDLIFINAQNMGQMFEAEEKLSADDLDAALKILEIAVGHDISQLVLSMNQNGQYYIQTVDSLVITTVLNEETTSIYLLCVLVG